MTGTGTIGREDGAATAGTRADDVSTADVSTADVSTADVSTDDAATPGLLRRMAALLDREPEPLVVRGVLPRGWHVGLFPTALPGARLRPDGYAGPGIALPDLGLPRVMLGGRRATYAGDIPLGATVRRRTGIASVAEKTGRGGRIALVSVRNALDVGGRIVVTEVEDYVLRGPAETEREQPARAPAAAPARDVDAKSSDPKLSDPRPSDVDRAVTPDEVMLFRYCAVTYNAHRIHYDAPYARDREGYPGLVVNGGLTALLVLELAREAAGREPAAFDYRTLRPLHCGHPVRLRARAEAAGAWRAWAEDEAGQVALEASFR